jgi:hypothetical protein
MGSHRARRDQPPTNYKDARRPNLRALRFAPLHVRLNMNIIARLFHFILNKLAPAEEDAARVRREGIGQPERDFDPVVFDARDWPKDHWNRRS